MEVKETSFPARHHVETLYAGNLSSNIQFIMLTTIATILVILWLLGYLGFHVLGSFIHILLVIAVIMFVFRIIQGRNPLA